MYKLIFVITLALIGHLITLSPEVTITQQPTPSETPQKKRPASTPAKTTLPKKIIPPISQVNPAPKDSPLTFEDSALGPEILREVQQVFKPDVIYTLENGEFKEYRIGETIPQKELKRVFLADESSLDAIVASRSQLLAKDIASIRDNRITENPSRGENLTIQYQAVQFTPGKSDTHGVMLENPGLDIVNKKIAAPDLGDPNDPKFKLDITDPNFHEKFNKMVLFTTSRVLSFGHDGMISIKLDQPLTNRSGADFSVIENPFIVKERGSNGQPVYFIETGVVGVAQNEGEIRWFPCDLSNKKYLGCAGLIPASKGGDAFDIESLGLDNATFIYIKDSGKNLLDPRYRGANMEGFDLDALYIP